MPEERLNGGGEVERPLPVLAVPPEEEVSAEVAEVEARPIERPAGSPLPGPVVAATGGFLAGFATLVAVRILRRRNGPLGLLRRRRRSVQREIAGSRSFLVDVHVLKR